MHTLGARRMSDNSLSMALVCRKIAVRLVLVPKHTLSWRRKIAIGALRVADPHHRHHDQRHLSQQDFVVEIGQDAGFYFSCVSGSQLPNDSQHVSKFSIE